jgi:hypothetical protein
MAAATAAAVRLAEGEISSVYGLDLPPRDWGHTLPVYNHPEHPEVILTPPGAPRTHAARILWSLEARR